MASDQGRAPALFDRVQRLCRRSVTLKADSVHQLRTSIRRIETLVAALPDAKERKLLKQLDRIRRRAGRVRDLDVQITALQGLRLQSIARDKAKVMQVLERARAKRGKKLLKLCREQMDGGLRKRLKRAANRIADLWKDADFAKAQARNRAYLSAALDDFAALVKQQPEPGEADLHEFRMACKRIRYRAEMAGETPEAAAVITQLKRIQDAIGIWHDWTTLSNTAESLLSHSARSPLVAAVRARTQSTYLEALRTTADARRVLLEFQRGKSIAKPVAAAKPAAAATKAASA